MPDRASQAPDAVSANLHSVPAFYDEWLRVTRRYSNMDPHLPNLTVIRHLLNRCLRQVLTLDRGAQP